jgi:hypothetical protein
MGVVYDMILSAISKNDGAKISNMIEFSKESLFFFKLVFPFSFGILSKTMYICR